MVTAVNMDTFESAVLDADTPVLVDVWAPWCGPCRMVDPIVKSVDKKMRGEVKVVKVNADDNQDLLYEFGIQGIPTLLYFQHGHLVDRMVGVQSEQTILDKLEEIKTITPKAAADREMEGLTGHKQLITMGIAFGVIMVVALIAILVVTL